MDNCRKKNSSGGSFSFPNTPNQDSDFEFGCLTPDSPSSDPCRTSPADHLFFNGRLLPHSFPFQQHPPIVFDNSRATSRTSSISSKDSLMSSRSNSTNSRSSSSCYSARTSSSDSSERKLFYNRVNSGKASMVRDRYQVNKMASAQAYGCSQRWQYITPVPALNRDVSRRRKGEQGKKEGVKGKKQTTRVSSRFGRRIFRWFVMACKECHAMEPSSKEKITLQDDVKL